MSKLSGRYRDDMIHKALKTYYLAFYRNGESTLSLEEDPETKSEEAAYCQWAGNTGRNVRKDDREKKAVTKVYASQL